MMEPIFDLFAETGYACGTGTQLKTSTNDMNLFSPDFYCLILFNNTKYL